MFVIDENGSWLLQNITSIDKTGKRKSSATEVEQCLAEVNNIMHKLNEDVNARMSRINAVLSDALSFEESCVQFDTWLKPVEKTLSQLKPVSVNLDELKEQALQHEVRLFIAFSNQGSK